MPAVLFGSISSLADTSELQRAAFNDAFAEHGLDWNWSQDEYRTLLGGNGGRQRIADYAAERGEQVDADAVHRTKSAKFQQSLASSHVEPRDGVADVVRAAKSGDWKLGLVTTTSPENLDALLAALGPAVSADDFDLVVDSSVVEQSKPDPAAYTYALDALGESPAACVAVEDNPGGVRSAREAGIACVAFANENTSALDFGDAPRVDRLAFDELIDLTSV